ncbi:MAG: helix-hairpin-helix domain-containing protein [Proteobacteria bacterium]|nr:helix-hairpin-helix domain-containing protein [Pseudomonadota bacterium]MDA0993252.1 helix-hairpin-helix domain-containing protein [Pseudomonadota bacterium]
MKNLVAALLLALVGTLGPAMLIADDGILNANTATAEELAAIPEMDEFLVQAVINNRPFGTISALNERLGADLSDEELQGLYAHVFVPINLNTADESDILLIPGVGSRMAHEFEEYRPYTSIEQFRKEIGKYVDEAEVARLEQYVTLE